MSFKIEYLKLLLHLPGTNELRMTQYCLDDGLVHYMISRYSDDDPVHETPILY